MPHTPQPLDARHVELPAGLAELSERLAKSVHEQWAAKRLAEGWRYGPRRDDDLKVDPSLVAYEQLPESERESHRVTAIETLKAAIALGFEISPPKTDTETP